MFSSPEKREREIASNVLTYILIFYGVTTKYWSLKNDNEKQQHKGKLENRTIPKLKIKLNKGEHIGNQDTCTTRSKEYSQLRSSERALSVRRNVQKCRVSVTCECWTDAFTTKFNWIWDVNMDDATYEKILDVTLLTNFSCWGRIYKVFH